MTKRKPQIAVLFPAFLGGGAEAVCLWIIEALKGEYDLTLFTFSDINFDVLNRFYATCLSMEDIRVIRLFPKLPRFVSDSYSFFSLRQHLLCRYFKNVGRDFDISISAFNEMDMGRPGIQYIHYPMFGLGHEPARRIVGHPDSTFRRIYRSICRKFSKFSDVRMKQNATITNSQWTAHIIKQTYQMDAHVIYPPVVADFPDVPWEKRENGFVCIARLVGEKNADKAVRILEMVREQGHDVHIHIISGKSDPKHLKRIEKLRKESSCRVFLEEKLTRQNLYQIVANHKYGIHVRENEQFGIGVAEMVKAGCIPLIPAKGGQVEIIGENELLAFDHEDEAARKIVDILLNEQLQVELRRFLARRVNLFTVDRFKAQIREQITRFCEIQKSDQN